jgi:hypothetical protein
MAGKWLCVLPATEQDDTIITTHRNVQPAMVAGRSEVPQWNPVIRQFHEESGQFHFDVSGPNWISTMDPEVEIKWKLQGPIQMRIDEVLGKGFPRFIFAQIIVEADEFGDTVAPHPLDCIPIRANHNPFSFGVVVSIGGVTEVIEVQVHDLGNSDSGSGTYFSRSTKFTTPGAISFLSRQTGQKQPAGY